MKPASLLRTVLVVLTTLSAAGVSPLPGQWRVGLEVGAARFWGGSIDTGGEGTSFRPYRPTTFGIGLERQAGRYAFALQLHYFQAGLALEGPEVVIASDGAFTSVSLFPEAALHVATLGNSQLWIHAGPILEVWDVIDNDTRTRLGAQGSVSLDVPLGSRFSGVLNAGGAVSPSPYEEGELDLGAGAPTYERRALWRRSFGVGVKYRL
ncbi:MAG TPA: hypothetical protein VD930_07080 [Gemmatimonadales bacterium]|nr:hypothetical protein [Gemmatimonadales bacterium]